MSTGICHYTLFEYNQSSDHNQYCVVDQLAVIEVRLPFLLRTPQSYVSPFPLLGMLTIVAFYKQYKHHAHEILMRL